MADNKPSTKTLPTSNYDKNADPNTLPTSRYDKNASPIPRQGNVGITSLPGTDYQKNAKPIKAYKDNALRVGYSKMFFTE